MKLTLWQKIKLMFIKPRISVDYDPENSKSCSVIFKVVDGIIVVQDVKFSGKE